MIPFKDITLADRDTITAFTMKSDRRNCDLSFSNLCSWRFLYDTQFAVIDDFLVFKFWAGEQAGIYDACRKRRSESCITEINRRCG